MIQIAEGTTAKVAYETYGDSTGRPLILIQGLTAQLIAWHPSFIEALRDAGFYVIAFDNRDAGESARFPDGGYSIGDMAEDVSDLMDALDIPRAHILGQSMGGMIAQEFAGTHPDRTASVTIFYSAPGTEALKPQALEESEEEEPATREEFIEQFVKDDAVFASQRYPQNKKWLHTLAARLWDGGYDSSGFANQRAAVMTSRDRSELVQRITAPTLIIHGTADQVIDPQGGRELNSLIPDSTLLLVAGMGHQIPEVLVPAFLELIRHNADRAEGRVSAPVLR